MVHSVESGCSLLLLSAMKNKLIKVGLYNAGSLGTNHDNFVAALGRSDADVLAVNETWLRKGEEGRAPTVAEYRLRHIPRPRDVRSRGGGVGFYIRRGVVARIWPHPVDPLHKAVEQMWISVTLGGVRLIIGTAYRPPWMGIDLFFDAIADSISSIPKYDNIILLGDFNINLMNNNNNTIKFNTFMTSFNLMQVVTQPTHFTSNSESLIDVVCTDLKPKSVSMDHVGSTYGHCLVVCTFNIKHERCPPRIVNYRPLNRMCLQSFNDDLGSVGWDAVSTQGNVNDMVEIFNYCIKSVFDRHAPVRSITVRERNPPWLTDNIKLMMKLRDRAMARYNKTKLETVKAYYKSLKSTVNKAIFYEKTAYFHFSINNKIKDPKLLWRNLKGTVLPKKVSELPIFINNADLINNHFLDVPGISVSSISQLTFFEHNRFGRSVFSLKAVSVDGIVKIVRTLRSNAAGHDSITLDMIVRTFPYSLQCIVDIINRSITTSTFPDLWKLAVVLPLPKTPNPTSENDLRPISILPCLSKILERVVCAQLTAYLEGNNILPEAQSGFRAGRSTTTALLDVTDALLCAQDKGLCTVLVLLDFSRAFDALNIDLLLSKLSFYGFDGKTIKWFNSYLSRRSQFVRLSHHDGTISESEILDVKRGVPQGSVLGPVLYSIYSADITKCITHCKFHIYADDTQLYISFRPENAEIAIKQLNEDLCRISDWSKNNSLLLNPHKTKYLLIGTKVQTQKIRADLDIKLNGRDIERVYEARNLGLVMDSELHFEKHIAKCIQNCFYKLKVLYHIRQYIKEELRVQLVEALVLSRLNYVDTVYGPRLLKKTQKLIQRVQNACARFCFNIPPRAHISPYLNKHSMLKMTHRRKLHLACLLFGIIKHGTPAYLFNKLSLVSRSNARKASLRLLTARHASAAFRGSFRYAATRCWNNIPPPLRDLQSVTQFKSRLKLFMLNHQISQETQLHDTSAL
jgi:hypothetical protein